MVDSVKVTMVTMTAMQTHPHSNLIVLCGDTGAVARLFGLSSQAVSKWKRIGIPDPWLRCLKNEKPDEYRQYIANQNLDQEAAA